MSTDKHFSELICKTILSPSYSDRNGCKVTKITIHHAAGVLSGESLAAIFKVPRRCASCNYAIGKDGEIIGVVPEDKRAWTSGSRWNDEQAITIEVSNSTGKPNWEVSEVVLTSLVKLCADICVRYNITPYYTGDKYASFTFHYMFQATECPGPFIKKNINSIIERIKKEMAEPTKPQQTKPEPKDDSFRVKVTCKCLNIRKEPSARSKKVGEITDQGVYTIVDFKDGWGKLKSGSGWICLKYTKGV